MQQFSLWLKGECTFLRMAHEFAPSANHSPISQTPVHNNAVQPMYTISTPGYVNCCFCGGSGHELMSCPKFHELGINQRWQLVKERMWCFGCLRPGHQLQTCVAKERCGLQGCPMPHHRLLHESPAVGGQSFPAIQATPNYCILGNSECLYKYVPISIQGPKGVIKTLCFIDEGSKASLID